MKILRNLGNIAFYAFLAFVVFLSVIIFGPGSGMDEEKTVIKKIESENFTAYILYIVEDHGDSGLYIRIDLKGTHSDEENRLIPLHVYNPPYLEPKLYVSETAEAYTLRDETSKKVWNLTNAGTIVDPPPIYGYGN